MKLGFDLGKVTLVEFGVGRDDGSEQTFVAVPVDADVQSALREMVQVTWDAMQQDPDGPTPYEPSEKHGATEYLTIAIKDEMASCVRVLHESVNLEIESDVLDDASKVFCYFVRLTDTKSRRLTALRRATQFKGVLKKRLIRFVSDSLKLIEESVFKLDNDFDLLSDSENVHILRPNGFEFAGKLQQAILDAVPNNIRTIQKELAFVVLDGIEAYARSHSRAARYLASIRSQIETKGVDKSLLKKLCKQTGVVVNESKGKVTVADGHEMGFLEVLDRRRYEVSLVKEKPERYRAASRREING